MERKLQIKAGNIGHLTDARYFAALNVTWMGFNFRKNDPQALQLSDAKTIQDWIIGPTIVAEFDEIDTDYIFQVCDQLQTNWIQLPQKTGFQSLLDYQTIIACTDSIVELSSPVKHTLNFTMHSTEQVQAILEDHPAAIFRIKNNLNLVKQIIQQTNLQAIEISGSSEPEVGLKSFDAINELFDWLEAEKLIE